MVTEPAEWDALLNEWRRAHTALLISLGTILDVTERVLEAAHAHAVAAEAMPDA